MAEIQTMKIPGALEALASVAQQKMSGRVALKVQRLYTELADRMSALEELRATLIEKYAERDEAGEIVKGEPTPEGLASVRLREDGREAFNEEWVAIVEAPTAVKVALTTADIEAMEISPGALVALEALLED